MPPRPMRRHRLPVVAAFLAAVVAFAIVPAASRLLPASRPVVANGLAAAAAAPPISAPTELTPLTADAATAPAGPIRPTARVGESPRPADPSSLTGYRWPLATGRLTLPFGPFFDGSFRVGRTNVHDGIDIASFCGAPVVAAHSGTVLAAGRHFDARIGWLGSLDAYYARLDRKDRWHDLPIALIVDDGNGYRSVYAHFERVVVRVGQRVRAGQLVGYEGATGHATGCHVHYGLFSPFETARYAIRPDIGRRLRTPGFEIARIDPLLVLPDGARVLRTGRLHEPFRTSRPSGSGPSASAPPATLSTRG
ncbi:MAG TPA: M23 family metallopeptidase [Candidatus Limnocylindrales bacterium]